jgi:hypothetical protein
MRTSFNRLSTNHLKKNEEEETNIIDKNVDKITKTDNKEQEITTKAPHDIKVVLCCLFLLFYQHSYLLYLFLLLHSDKSAT